MTGSGVADGAAKKATVSLRSVQDGTTVKMDGVAIGADMWFKLDSGDANEGLGIPTKYMHADPSRFKDRSNIPFAPDGSDPCDVARLFEGLVDAQRVDNRHYTIILDLTHVNAASVDKEETLTTPGDQAKAVPGTVTLDDQGRLSELNVDLSAVNPSASDQGHLLRLRQPGHGRPAARLGHCRHAAERLRHFQRVARIRRLSPARGPLLAGSV